MQQEPSVLDYMDVASCRVQKHQPGAHHAYQAPAAVKQGPPTVACSAQAAAVGHGRIMKNAAHDIAVQPKQA